MATNTTNLELKKPAYSDTADISDINGNMDIIDTAVNAVENGMAIIANGNTHTSITSGQYVYIRKHGSLSEGLYKATQTIATDGTLSLSNVTAVSGGALNTLNEQITNVTKKKTVTGTTDAYGQISLGLDPRTDAVLCVGVSNNNYWHTWLEDFNSGSQHFWQVRVFNDQEQLQTSKSVTLDVWYSTTWTSV